MDEFYERYVKDQDYTLEDQTGLADSCAVVDGGEGPGPEGVLLATPGADRALSFWWVDGVCGDRTMRLTQATSDFALEVIEVWEPEPGGQTPGPCPAIGIFRSARIQLAQ